MTTIFLHSQLSTEGILLIFLVLGLIGGVFSFLIYSFIISFFPDKKVKTKDILIIFGSTTVLSLGYFILLSI